MAERTIGLIDKRPVERKVISPEKPKVVKSAEKKTTKKTAEA